MHGDLLKLNDGQSLHKAAYWDQRFGTGLGEKVWNYWKQDDFELVAFSSNVQSAGNFEFLRRENRIIVSGSVVHRWLDDFDFDPGKPVPVVGQLALIDQGRLAGPLLDAGIGKPFDFDVSWHQSLSAELAIINGNIKKVRHNWSEVESLN